jgi:aspartate/methionine/tyrosine aminotransferase
MSDEIYGCIASDNTVAPTIASLPGMMERTIIVEYQKRREVIVDSLNSLPGITCQ